MTKIYHDLNSTMLDSLNSEKTLDVKIRPFSSPKTQEPANQLRASYIHLNGEAMRELNLKAGEICYLWKADEGVKHIREAIAWPTVDKSTSKKVLQMTKTFQEATGFKLADDLKICSAPDHFRSVKVAETITLRDITKDEAELTEEEKHHWQWYVGNEFLKRAVEVFPGMTFQNVRLSGPLRTFEVESVNGSTTNIGTFSSSSSSVKISRPVDVSQPRTKFEVVDIAGIDQALESLNEFLAQFDKEFKFQRAQRSCAALLHGGHGTGKTFILDKICKSGWGKHITRIRSDAKPETIRTIFKNAKLSLPSIIAIDNLEKLVGKEGAIHERITEALEDELDILAQSHSGSSLPRVLVIAATLDISLIPRSLRKLGRFQRDIPLPVPDASARKAILKSLEPQFAPEVHDAMLDRLGDRTHAYTAEDLAILLSRAYEISEMKGDPGVSDDSDLGSYVTQEDLDRALLDVRPTAMHDITLQPPSVRWDEIGGQDSVKKALRVAVETPLIRHERVKRLGGSPTKGILLYGPPGCSKTLTAQAMATEIGYNFFAVKGAELLNMYVGESERAVRNIFARARAASPSIIFFDEIESIGSKRDSSGRNNGINVLTTLLNEMDGIETLKGVTVLAATNQPQALDLALLRPGRFDQLLYVAPPDHKGIEEILHVRKRKMDFADDVNIPELATKMEGHSGAEVVGICQAAFNLVLEKCEATGLELQIHMEDFENAIPQVKKQITPELVWNFKQWATGARGTLG